MGRITQGLFGLGISNVAANRAVVRELTLKLKGASKEELNDLARQEIHNVIKQLKEQEDIMNEQSKLAKRISEVKQKDAEQDGKIAVQEERDKEHDKRLDEGVKKDIEQDAIIAAQEEKDKEHDKRLDESDKKDAAQDVIIAIQEEKDKEHDKRLDEGDKKDAAQDAIIATQEEKDKKHDQLFQNLHQENEQLKHNIEENHISIQKLSKNVNELFEIKTDKKVTVISLVISVVAVVLACAKFFI